MKKIIYAIAAVLPLSGCWWDEAPETYKGVATVRLDNGKVIAQDFACDFRAQQATRTCDFQLKFTRYTENNKPPVVYPVVMNVAVSGHAREEDRYMVVVAPPFPDLNWKQRNFQHRLEPWGLKPEPVARTEAGLPAYIATEDTLVDGVSAAFTFIPSRLNDAATAGTIDIKWEPVPANSLSS